MHRIAALLLVTPFAAGAAAGQDFRPAGFANDDPKRRLDKLIAFPKVDRDITVMMSCFTQVDGNGRLDDTGCFMRDQYDSLYVAAVKKAAKKARGTPAIVDGKTAKVYVQFRIEFKAQGEDRFITLYLNPGYEENVKAYGLEHIAGQRVVGNEDRWQEACPRHAGFGVWARAFLGEDGRAESPSLEHANGVMPIAACQEAIKAHLVESRYTPAFSEGEPVPSTYVEPFGN